MSRANRVENGAFGTSRTWIETTSLTYAIPMGRLPSRRLRGPSLSFGKHPQKPRPLPNAACASATPPKLYIARELSVPAAHVPASPPSPTSDHRYANQENAPDKPTTSTFLSKRHARNAPIDHVPDQPKILRRPLLGAPHQMPRSELLADNRNDHPGSRPSLC